MPVSPLHEAIVGVPTPRHDVDLVISGAGSHGITEAAALRALSDVMTFKRVGGASAGAINAAGLAFGFTPQYMVDTWRKLLSGSDGHDGLPGTGGNLEDWKYPVSWFKPLGLLQGRGGAMKGERIRAALTEVFTSATMGESIFPLRIKVASMRRRKTETVYSDGYGPAGDAHKRLKVVDVVMCSLAVPFLIDAQVLDPTRPVTPAEPLALYCDGGTGDNVPRALWDDADESAADSGGARPTTVVRFLDTDGEASTDDIWSRVKAVIGIVRDAAEDEQSAKPKTLMWDVAIAATGSSMDFSLDLAECARREHYGDFAGRDWIRKNTY